MARKKGVNGFKPVRAPKEKLPDKRVENGWAAETLENFVASGKPTYGKQYDDIEELIKERNRLATWMTRHRQEYDGIRLIKRDKMLYLVNTNLEEE